MCSLIAGTGTANDLALLSRILTVLLGTARRYAKDNQRSLQLMDKAYAIYCYELGRDNPRTLEVRTFTHRTL
jgi:hypothetical protein